MIKYITLHIITFKLYNNIFMYIHKYIYLCIHIFMHK